MKVERRCIEARTHSKHEPNGIYVPEEMLQKQRSLGRYRTQLVGDITGSKNGLKGLLKYQGIDVAQQLGPQFYEPDSTAGK